VLHRDVVPLHVDQLRCQAARCITWTVARTGSSPGRGGEGGPSRRAGVRGFTGYTHRPGQLGAEITASGLRLTDLVSVEGPAFLLSDLGERLADDQDRQVVIETAAALERVPELIGIGPHLLATAHRPPG
jgi:hypothetical protein